MFEVRLGRDSGALGYLAERAVEDYLHVVGGVEEGWDPNRAVAVFANRVRYSDLSETVWAQRLGDLADVFANHAELQRDKESWEFFQGQARAFRTIHELLRRMPTY